MTKTKDQIRALCEGCSGPEMCPAELTAGDVLALLDEVERLRKGESDDLTIAYMAGYSKGVEDGANRHLLPLPPSLTQSKAPEPKK